MKNLIIDCFAGGGGASVGIEMALGRQVDIAINHDPDAILMHKTNHPKTLHLTEDIFTVDLKKHVKDEHVALLWASPDCFPAGNLVWTEKGYKNIEDVQCFDKVLTHTGELHTVTRTIKKNDRKFRNIKIAGCEPFQATLNHPFYARKKKIKCIHGEHRTTKTILQNPEWIKAEDLTNEYRVAIPINTNAIIPKWEGCIYKTSNTYGPTITKLVNELSKYMDNENFWWIVGRYFGDGHVSVDKCTVDICCSFDEVNEIKNVLDKLDLKYGERDKKTTHSFLFYNKELCEFLSRFGVGSLEKNITPDILDLPKNLLKSFMEGYISADGHWDYSLSNPRCSVQTVSRKLAYGLQQCLLKAYDRYASLVVNENPNTIIEGRKVNSHNAYVLIFYRDKTNRLQYEIEDNIAWVNVKSCETVNDYQKSVYTLSVEKDESFTVNNIAVHNCTSHSKAKGGKPRERGLRILPWAVYKHAKTLEPNVIIMENVEEITKWGPLDEHGHPIKEKEGLEYERFMSMMESLGYKYETKELVAADYGAPTTRKRWYAILRRDGKPINWPEATHNKDGSDGLEKWIPIHTCLDFTDLGKSIFGRKKPLAKNTMNRIARGLKKFVFENPDPFMFVVTDPDNPSCNGLKTTPFVDKAFGGNYSGGGSSVEEPVHTITTVDHNRLVSPVVAPFMLRNNTGAPGSDAKDPILTITTGGHHGIISPYMVQVNHSGEGFRGQSVEEPLPTITQKHGFGTVAPVVVPYASEESLKNEGKEGAVDASDCHGHVQAFLTKFYKSGTGQSMFEPIHTITTSPGHFGQVSVLTVNKEELFKAGVSEEVVQKCTWVSEFIMEYYGTGTGQSVKDPLHTIVTKERFALITVLGNEHVILDIYLRMLTPEELKLGQGFPKDYIIDHTWDFGQKYPVAKQVARIGNSVVPIMAKKLVEANCGYLKVGEREERDVRVNVYNEGEQMRFA